jgi:tetratricopeptide (TPR) repeat protein
MSAAIIAFACLLASLSGCMPAAGPKPQQDRPPAADSAAVDTARAAPPPDVADAADTLEQGLSPASNLMLRACDNYLEVIPDNPKKMEVLRIKASVYYNNDRFERSREVYKQILDRAPEGDAALDAVRMIAQSHYQQEQFEDAQRWYRKLRDISGEGANRQQASARIAESIFRMAEVYESRQLYQEAAEQYERVSLEFPDAAIADAALLNSGLAYEKLTDWARAILMYQRLRQRHADSRLVPKAMFRTAKAYEKLLQWENAAQTYLRLAAAHPRSEYAPTSLYNAGFSFENAEKLAEAAATFEKLAATYPDNDEAADVLFRAGELYGKLKDWPNVTRVNQEFSRRYGNDIDRVVQAKCMMGVALYMQERGDEALTRLREAIDTYTRLRDASTVNTFYAAKAQFTIAEIYHQRQNEIALRQPRDVYRTLLQRKSALLDRAVEAYSRVIGYEISEWTTRSIYHIGKSYEDFALGVFRQERPGHQSLEKTLSLELGIAQALEEYFVDRALHYHQQNVKLGIKQSLEDKHIIASRRKLTYLPVMAGETYLALVDIALKSEQQHNLEGFSLIAHKLQSLQKIAPFQERAIDLFLKSLELGTMYQEQNEFYERASSLITKVSFTVGQTYADVVRIAREAPIPDAFDPYEAFAYKTKLLKQIEEYEQSALQNYLKTLQIADAYAIEDSYVSDTKAAIAQVLFMRGRAYDLLCINAFTRPPYPANTSETEKEEYRARFEEVGLRLQERAFGVYRTIMDYVEKGLAEGAYVNHAYVRLYQHFPAEYGREHEKIVDKSLSTGPQWKTSRTADSGWAGLDYRDGSWMRATKGRLPDTLALGGFPEETPTPMWLAREEAGNRGYFRRTFYLTEPPHQAVLFLASSDSCAVSLNGDPLHADTAAIAPYALFEKNLTGRLRQGKNVLAIAVSDNGDSIGAVLPYASIRVAATEYLPVFPGAEEPLAPDIVAEGNWSFPRMRNFSLPSTAHQAEQ